MLEIKMKKPLKKEIELPEGIEAKIEISSIVITGALGSIKRMFKFRK